MTHLTTRDRLIGIVSAVVALVGLVIHVVASFTPVSFGWFGDPEVPAEIFTSGAVFILTRNAMIGAILFVAGVVGVAFTIGAARGARRCTETRAPLG